ncbi:MAG TPA: GNA1162 family protein [Nitrospiraceae bacterium]|nr:GNA1162 family protein [Nitrospiraceae bacterium]
MFLLIGCAGGGGEGGGAVVGVKDPASVKYRVTSLLKEKPPKLVAILPFENLSGKTADQEEEAPAYVIRTAFLNRFVPKQYPTQRTVVTDRLLQEKGYVKAEEIVKLPLSKLGEITKADTVLYGQITHFHRYYAGLYAQIAVGAKLKMVDVQSGEVLWETGDVSRVHSGGFATDPLGIVMILATNALALRHIEVVRASEELFRDLLETLPRLSTGEAVRPPMITLMVNDSSTQTKKAGDQIKVAMQGDPNMLATFDIGQYKSALVMQEEKPGIYAGSYTVKPGDNVENAIVIGHLSDRQGLQADWEDAVGPVTLDTAPPAVPVGLATLGRDKTVSLRWKANGEKDLAGYRLYRSATALTGFTLLATSESLTLLDSKELVNKQRYYYRITAFDRVGNESVQSDAIPGTPVPPGPTPVSGTIALNTTWFAGASPYVLEGDVTVAQGATLTIEPGTVVTSKGGGLHVRGGLIAIGAADQLILMTIGKEKAGGHWAGVLFDHTGDQESVLERVRVTDATAGVTCVASSPKIFASELTENGTGLIVRHASSHPVVERNQIVLNRTDGVSVQDAAKPLLVANRIAQNKRHGIAASKVPGLLISGNELLDNEGLQVWNASGTETIDLSGNWWGSKDGAAVLAKVDGAVLVKDYLDGPLPDGKTVVLPALEAELGGTLSTSAFLLAAKSPYLVTHPLVIDKGATLSIQAGVVIRFKAGDNSLVVRDGAIQALGTAVRPITMTSANAAPRPGDYTSAVRFESGGQQPSFLQHVRIEYAATAVQVKEGNPEISHAFIAHNLQSAMECAGKSAPKISYSTLTEHANNAAVICSGRSQPVLYRNNIIKNAWGVINHSSLPLEARENWWGMEQPDEGLFLGTVEFKPSLKQPDPDAVSK